MKCIIQYIYNIIQYNTGNDPVFPFYADLPESEAAELQNKLEVLNNIMDQEVRDSNIHWSIMV